MSDRIGSLPPPLPTAVPPYLREPSESPGTSLPALGDVPISLGEPFVLTMLVVSNIMQLVIAASAWMQLDLLTGGSFTPEQAEANDNREMYVARAFLACYLVTVVAFGIWIVKANRRVREMGAHSMRFSPGSALGYFFVPILNLFRPYQAMKELWLASLNPREWQLQESTVLLPIWWTFWIVSGLLGQFSFRFSMRAETLEQITDLTRLGLAKSAWDFALGIIAFRLVWRISGNIRNCQPRLETYG